MQCPISGCGGAPRTLASGQNEPVRIVVDSSNAYWTDIGAGTIMTVPLAAGVHTPTQLAADPNAPSSIAVDSQYLYWGDLTNGYLVAKPLAGGPAFTLASRGGAAVAIGIEGACVYWVDTGDGTVNVIAEP
jgi:hypothetical protein